MVNLSQSALPITTNSPTSDTSGSRRLAVLTWLKLARVFQKIDHNTAQRFRCMNLSVAQFDMLSQIGLHEGITQQELADVLLVTKGNVCQLVDRMERAELIVRRQEGRSNRLYLTDDGRCLFERVVPTQEDLIEQQFSALSGEEQDQLLSLLRKLDQALD